MAEIREIVREVPGVKVNIGQPISHRLDHMMSGIRSQIAVKLYGRDIEELRDRGQDIAEMMTAVPGVVDLQIEPQVDIPQVRVTIRRLEAARYGLAPADVAEALETALQGRTVSQVLEGQRVFDLVVWFDEEARNNIDVIRSTLISTPDGSRVALGTVADVVATQGPNTINRENVQRRIVIQCNTAGRDLVSVVHDIQQAADEKIQPDPQGRLFHRVRRAIRGPAGRQPPTAAAGQLRHRRHLPAALQVPRLLASGPASDGEHSLGGDGLGDRPVDRLLARLRRVRRSARSGSGRRRCSVPSSSRWPTGSASSP